jgi:hypothetical protein
VLSRYPEQEGASLRQSTAIELISTYCIGWKPHLVQGKPYLFLGAIPAPVIRIPQKQKRQPGMDCLLPLPKPLVGGLRKVRAECGRELIFGGVDAVA